jgi:myo-inositol-1(or 4)-monophosphatase
MPDRRREDLRRIREALDVAAAELAAFTPGRVEVERKQGGDPVTEADRRVDRCLRELLPSPGEGWLSEETRDDAQRLTCERVWVVDPLDGTREFVEGLPEWCVSVGLVEGGRAVAGGILNPATGQLFLGSIEHGLTLNGAPAAPSDRAGLSGATMLASRSEVRRGEWERFTDPPFEVVPCGSVAYKLAQVAAGLADLTWTLVPKHEWDVAAGVALVLAAGGDVFLPPDGSPPESPEFNRARPLLPGLVACPAGLTREVVSFLNEQR